MNFTTHNDSEINSIGTGFIGEIEADYKTLKKIFGQPTEGDKFKMDAHWEIQFDNGMVATIYNWKDGISYNGRTNGVPKTKITEWHVGGHDDEVLELVKKALEPKKTFYSIRVVLAEDYEDAVRNVEDNYFNESNPLCDLVLTKEEILKIFKRKSTK